MEGLVQLNVDGCGVCKRADWSRCKNPTRWEKFKSKLSDLAIKLKLTNYKPPKKEQPWCTIHNKYVDQMHKCIQYCPKKQIKIFGAAQDEEIKVRKEDYAGL